MYWTNKHTKTSAKERKLFSHFLLQLFFFLLLLFLFWLQPRLLNWCLMSFCFAFHTAGFFLSFFFKILFSVYIVYCITCHIFLLSLTWIFLSWYSLVALLLLLLCWFLGFMIIVIDMHFLWLMHHLKTTIGNEAKTKRNMCDRSVCTFLSLCLYFFHFKWPRTHQKQTHTRWIVIVIAFNRCAVLLYALNASLSSVFNLSIYLCMWFVYRIQLEHRKLLRYKCTHTRTHCAKRARKKDTHTCIRSHDWVESVWSIQFISR